MTEPHGGDDNPTQHIDLVDEAFDDDLQEQLEALAPRKLATRTTLILASVVLVVAGFLGGIYTQKEFGSSSDGNSSGSARSGMNMAGGAMPSGMGRQGMASGAAGGRADNTSSTTTGKVKMVDGTTIYIETTDGKVITVKTTTSTSVETATASSLTELSVGSQVTVEGTTSDSTISAT
ncbi:MAG: hypothetical protein JXA67_19835, partial [Micromonosporaceae bacterium]|nr:hypothetical protein [Micromonosporaceae bacterium]